MAQIAAATGVTVRTLHHYDEIGLLVPAARSQAEYRLYGADELRRLREILVWRRLGLSLAQIARLLDDPSTDREAVVEAQLSLVRARLTELRGLEAALEDAIAIGASRAADREERHMSSDTEIIDALGGFDPAAYEPEVVERWGDSDAYHQSSRRVATYTPEQWRQIRAAESAHVERLRALFDAGARPTDEEVVAAAEAWRQHVSRWFYECSAERQRALGELYVLDPRFRATYEGAEGERPGMAEWVRDAWAANADRLV